ncbi:hypothetical protein [uncultured Bradyrhizobium sp.]|uniref:hypothetical protein n=1 Tax=uncultured Bradyrhizobium sp. TaxID=199684 RepID=UPI0035CBD5A2
MSEYVIRFFLGGIVVSAFAVLGDLLRPKSFAGLFGAAPSIALVTLGLALNQHGRAYAAIEAHSMIWGATALLLYSALVGQLLLRLRLNALKATIVALPFWLLIAFGMLAILGGQS